MLILSPTVHDLKASFRLSFNFGFRTPDKTALSAVLGGENAAQSEVL